MKSLLFVSHFFINRYICISECFINETNYNTMKVLTSKFDTKYDTAPFQDQNEDFSGFSGRNRLGKSRN
jgi:hypothetical protein